MGFLTAFARITLDMTVVTLLIMCLPGFPPYTTFEKFELPPSPPWTGALQANEKLNLVDRLFENKLKGPESFAVRDGAIYTGLMSGVIVKIDPDALTFEPVAKIGEYCEEQYEEYKCGRPLGMSFTKTGKLLVCDAVFGLYLLDLDKKVEENRILDLKDMDKVDYKALLTPDAIINGSQNVLFNSLVLSKDDETVFLTVSSTRFPLRDSSFELISDPSGRVIKYNLRTKETETLVDNINFANGIEIDPEEKFILFCETGRAKIHKYYLKGDKAGQHEVLAENLPGLPDNIKINDNGHFYVGMTSPRIPGKPHLLEIMGPHNWIRKFLSRLVSMVLLPFKTVNSIMPNAFTLKFEYWCGNLEPLAHLAPPYGLVVELDGTTGEIVSSLHSTNGAVRFIAEAFVHDRWIYFGSPYNNYLARIPKRLRYTSQQKSSAGVTLGLLNDPEPVELPGIPSSNI